MDEETLIILGILAVLAVVGIVVGLTNTITNILVSLGAGANIAGQFGALLFFLILLGLIVLGWRGITGA